MRTTLDLDEDILRVAKQLAFERKTSTGKVISDLVRKSLRPRKAPLMRNGVEIFEPKPGAKPMTLDYVNKLRDEE